VRDEYHVSPLSSSDIVIDVGAHIGAFTCTCFARGAGRIVAFEPDADSFSLLTLNAKNYLNTYNGSGTVELHNAAVWRSDKQQPVHITSARFNSILRSYHHAAQCTLFNDADTVPVESIGLDSVLDSFTEVTLLKLDCEGAEWPILFTSRQLNKVARLLLEVHSLPWKIAESGRSAPSCIIDEFGSYTIDDLKDWLRKAGLVCVRDKIDPAYLNNPVFYFGLLEFENCGRHRQSKFAA
jgi:FkbM family methyltransferase